MRNPARTSDWKINRIKQKPILNYLFAGLLQATQEVVSDWPGIGDVTGCPGKQRYVYMYISTARR